MSLAFDHIRFRIHRRRYTQIRAIMAESGESDTRLKCGLSALHGITFSGPLDEDREIFFTEDTQQLEELQRNGVPSPTMMQLILTSKAFAFDEEECKNRWFEAMEAMNRDNSEPKIITLN